MSEVNLNLNNFNEEITNMVKFQQAYQLSAKIMSVMDEVFDVLINRLGA